MNGSRLVYSFTKTDTPPEMMQIVPRHIFRLFWFVFLKFPENWNIFRYDVLAEDESINSILNQFQLILNSNFSCLISPNKEKRSNDHGAFPADQ